MESQLYLWINERERFKTQITLYKETFMSRVVPIFAHVEEEANQLGEDFFNRVMAQSVNAADVDPGDLAERAMELSLDYYENFALMRYNNLVMWISTLYQYWEQQVRRFLFREMEHTFQLDFKSFCSKGVTDIKGCFVFHGVDIETLRSWGQINELRLLCNVIKHGDGGAATQLRGLKGELFRDVMGQTKLMDLYRTTLLAEVLNINEKLFAKYADALIDFWDELPERAFSKDL